MFFTRMPRCFWLVMIAIACVSATGQARLAIVRQDTPPQEPTPVSTEVPAFLLRKVETQVQRRLLGLPAESSGTIYYLEMNGNRFLETDPGSAAAWEQLKMEVEQIKGENLGIFRALTFFESLPSIEIRQLIQKKREAILGNKFAGQGSRSSLNPDSPSSWADAIKPLLARSANDSQEVVFGNNDVTAFSIEAPLSAYLANGGICHIEIAATLDQEDGFLDSETRDFIRKFVKKRKIPTGGRLYFSIKRVSAKENWVEEFQKELKVFCKSLGFSGATFSYSPSNVDRVEGIALVGQKAVDFELEELESGTKRKLSEINDGHFVILNFWGDS